MHNNFHLLSQKYIWKIPLFGFEFLGYTPSVSKYMFILEINFVSQYLSISSFNAKLIIVLSIIPLYIYYKERKNRMK